MMRVDPASGAPVSTSGALVGEGTSALAGAAGSVAVGGGEAGVCVCRVVDGTGIGLVDVGAAQAYNIEANSMKEKIIVRNGLRFP